MAEKGEAPKQYTSWVNKIKKPIAGLLLAIGLNSPIANKTEPSYAPISNKYVTSAESFIGKSIQLRDIYGCKIYSNNNQEIIGYSTQEGNFYGLSREAVDVAKKKAKETGEPEILDVIRINGRIDQEEIEKTSYEKNKQSLEYKTEMIDQAVSNEELAKRNITIHNNSETKLYIRESAFEKGRELENYKINGDNFLDIYLIPGDRRSVYYMKDLPKEEYARMMFYDYNTLPFDKNGKRYLPTNSELRQKNIEEFKESISRLRKQYKPDNPDMIPILAEEKARLIISSDTSICTDKEIISYNVEKIHGVLYRNGLLPPRYDSTAVCCRYDSKTTIIPLCTENYNYNNFIAIYVDQNGVFESQIINLYGDYKSRVIMQDSSPKAKYSFPSIKDYSDKNPAKALSAGYYKWGDFPYGHVLHHEIAHATNPGNTEYQTDELAAKYIEEAHDVWVKSGKKNDKLYPFIFENLKTDQLTITKTDSLTHAL